MKYSDAITRIARQVRPESTWPTDGTRLAEQLELVYAAVLLHGRDAALQDLTSKEEALNFTLAGTGYRRASLPSDVFTERGDLGVYSFEFGTVGVKYPGDGVSLNHVRRVAGSALQTTLFHFDVAGRRLFVTANPDAPATALRYVSRPIEPTTGNYTATDIPLPVGLHQSVVQMVSMHVEGVVSRDPAIAQFHSLLSQLYGDKYAGQPA